MSSSKIILFDVTRVYTRCISQCVLIDENYNVTITGGLGLYVNGKMNEGKAKWMNWLKCPWWPIKIESRCIYATFNITIENSRFFREKYLYLKKMLPYFGVNFSDPTNVSSKVYDIFVFTAIFDDIPPSDEKYRITLTTVSVEDEYGEDVIIYSDIEYWAISVILTKK